MQLSVKLFFEDEIRRVAIGDDNGDVTFKHLEEAISCIFPAVVGKPFKISWKDEDEDSITITTTPELHEAIRTQQKNFGVVKFQVALTKRAGPESNRVESEPHIVHAGVGCDECGVCPIPGTRYKCTVRFNFDLCSNCEAKGPQPYPMMKITKPHEATPSIVKEDGAQTSPFGCPFGPHGGRGGLGGRGGAGMRGCGFPSSPHHPFGGAFPYGGPPPPPFWGRGPMLGPSLGPSSSFGPAGQTPAQTPYTSSVPRVTEADTQAVHANIQCNECGVCPITGPRFKCTVRKNYDLCGKCEEGHRNHIGNLGAATGTEMCPMLKIAHPEQAPVDDTFVYAFAKHRHSLIYKELHHASKHGVVTLPPAVHRFIRCDGCGCRPITGTRFKCTVRPDFDLCEHCEATRPQPYPMVKIYRARHRPAYIVYHPRDPLAAATFASRVTALNNGQAATPLTTHSEPAPPVAPAAENAAAAVVHRHVSCDECGMSPIVGIRYKCSKRPNFDLCAGCEAKRPVQPFPMIMMTSPQGQLRSLRLEFQQPQAGATVDVNSDVHPIVITADHLPEEAAVPESAGNSSSNTPAPPAPRPILIQVHHGVRCDVCDQNPITGPRFKCTLREDYDLCGTCEAAKRGESTAPMLKIYDPAHHPSVMVCVFDAPVGGHQRRGFHHHRHGPDHGLHAGRGGGWGGRGGHWRARAAWDQVLNAASAAVAPAFIPTAPSAVPNLPKPALRFVRDVTLPDGTDVVGGSMGLKKVWLVRNDGQHQWPDGCRLVFAGGDALHEADPPVDPSAANLHETNACVPQVAMRFPPLLKPNEEGELRVTLNTPLLPGRFVSYFRMQTAEGQNFGQRVWSDLAVQMPDDMPVANDGNAEEDEEDVEDVPIVEKPTAFNTDEEDEDFARAMKEALQVHPSATPLDVKQEDDDDDDLLSVVLQESLLSSASAANSPAKHLEKEKLQAVREEEEEEDAEVLESDPLPADGLPVADADWAVVNHDCSDLFDDHEDEVSSPRAGAGSSVAVSGLVGSTLSSTGAATSSLSTSTILRASYENACADVDYSSDEEDHEKLTSDLLNISIVSDGSLHDNNSNGDAAGLAAPAVQSQTPPVQSDASSTTVAPFIAGMDRLSEQESSRRLWAREIEMIRAMGFCPNEEDLDDMLLPLLVKYAQSPADPAQGRSVNTDGLHTVLSVLLMSESSHK